MASLSGLLIFNHKIEEAEVKIKSTLVRLVRFNHLLNFLYRDVGVEVHVYAICIMVMMKQFIRHNILSACLENIRI